MGDVRRIFRAPCLERIERGWLALLERESNKSWKDIVSEPRQGRYNSSPRRQSWVAEAKI